MTTQSFRRPFHGMGDFLHACMNFRDGSGDDRLVMQAVAGLGSATGSSGGFLMQEDLAEGLWRQVQQHGRIIRRCRLQPVTGRGATLSVPAIDERSRANGSRLGGVALKWVKPGELLPQSKPGFSTIRFEPKKLAGVVYATDELIDDIPAFAAYFEQSAAGEVAFDVEDAIIGGTGVGEPLGIANSPAAIEVSKEDGQAASTIHPVNFAKMAARLWSASHDNAVWLMSNEVYEAVLNIPTSEWFEGIVTAADGRRRLQQIPVELCEYTAPLGQRGDVVLADFSQYALSERKQAAGVLQSIHVRFIHDETAFRVVARVDGAPLWASPITPKNGESTQSPFVLLGARE